MNIIQGTKPSGRKWNIFLDAVVTILKYKKSTIDYAIYIKVFTDGTVSYLTVSTDDIFNTTNNENAFPELLRFFEEPFEMKVLITYFRASVNVIISGPEILLGGRTDIMTDVRPATCNI